LRYLYQTLVSKATRPVPTLSSKRQITLPKELCDRLAVKPGDDLEMLEYEGRITILKKREGQSRGALKHLLADPQASDTESRDDVIAARRSGSTTGRTAA